MFGKLPIHHNFISSIDKALAKFNTIHPFSRAQQEEFDKYQRIYALRDRSITQEKTKDLWDFT